MITSATKSPRWLVKPLILTWLAAAASAPLTAADVYLRDLGSNRVCRIVTPGASNTTPVQITCAAPHHFVIGDLIKIANVPGNMAANGLRKVKTIPSATTFTITDTNGVDVAGSGAWSNGDQAPGGAGWFGGIQMAGKVSPYTLRGHPKLLIDPTGNLIEFAASLENGLLVSIAVADGTATATYSREHGLLAGQRVCVYGATASALNCATPSASFLITAVPSTSTLQFAAAGVANGTYNSTNLTVSAWAQGQNPAWVAVNTGRGFLESYYQTIWGADYQRQRSTNFAVICYVNRADATACAVAKKAITQAEDMASNFGLDENVSGQYGNDINTDFISFYLYQEAMIYNLIRPILSPTERAEFAGKMLNDLADPVLGGDCSKLLRVNRTGTISHAGDYFGITPINGIGTQFLTDLAVGTVIEPPSGTLMGSPQYLYVTSVTDNTNAAGIGVSWNGPFSTIAPRSANSCGALWYAKHFTGSPLGHPLLYPVNGGTTIYGVSPLSNTTLSKTWSYLAIGLALADDDPRAASLVTDTSLWFIDYTYPTMRNYWTGFSGSGSNYHYARVAYMMTDIAAMLKNSVASGPDFTQGQHFKNLGAHLRFMFAPNANNSSYTGGVWGWGADAGSSQIFNLNGGKPPSFAAGMALNPTDPEIQKTNYWLRSVYDMNAGVLSTSSGYYASDLFLRAPPTIGQIDYRTGPTQRLFRGTDRAACLAPGTVECPEDGGFTIAISRTGWTNPNDTVIGYEGGDFYGDHSVQRGGDYVIYKNTWLVAGDHPEAGANAGTPQFHRYNQYEIGGASIKPGEYATTYGRYLTDAYDSRMSRWAGASNDEGLASNAYAYWLNDLTRTMGGGVVNRLHRHVAHLKQPGSPEYLILYDDAATATATSLKFYTHYAQNGQSGEGTTVCASGCAALDTTREISSQTTGTVNSVVTRFIAPPGAATRVYVDNTTNGTFSGSQGYTFRATACAGSGSSCATNANSYELLTVHQIAAGAPGAIEVTALNPTVAWTGVQLTGKVALFSRKGVSSTSLPPTVTTHAGNAAYLVAGLQAGRYRFLRNGDPVAGCTDMTVLPGDQTAYCDAIASGTIQLISVGGPSSGIGGASKVGATAGLQK